MNIKKEDIQYSDLPDKLITAEDIQNIAGVGSSAVPNWRSRDKGFPSEVTNKPVLMFSRDEALKWLASNGYKDEVISEVNRVLNSTKSYITKKIAIVGPAKSGKSRTMSKFSTERKFLSQLFSEPVGEKTKVNIELNAVRGLYQQDRKISFKYLSTDIITGITEYKRKDIEDGTLYFTESNIDTIKYYIDLTDGKIFEYKIDSNEIRKLFKGSEDLDDDTIIEKFKGLELAKEDFEKRPDGKISFNGMELEGIEELDIRIVDMVRKSLDDDKQTEEDFKIVFKYNRSEVDKDRLNESEIIITTGASKLALMSMEDDDYGLKIIDTPGLEGGQTAIKAANANMYIIMMESTGHGTSESVFEAIRPFLGSAKIIFGYRFNDRIDNEQYYDIAYKQAYEAIEYYSESIERAILSEEEADFMMPPDILNINRVMKNDLNKEDELDNIVVVPQFDLLYEVNESEKIFDKELSGAIYKYLRDEDKQINEMIETIEPTEENQKFVKELISGLTNKIVLDSSEEDNYMQQFVDNEHERVMSGDRYRIYRHIDSNRAEVIEKFTKVISEMYSKIGTEHKDVDSMEIFRAVYFRGIEFIKRDIGLGIGNFHSEYKPPITMWGIESVFADQIINNGGDTDATKYQEVMKRNKIESATWSYVSLDKFSGRHDALAKLRIIKDYKLANGVVNENHAIEEISERKYVHNTYFNSQILLSFKRFLERWLQTQDLDLDKWIKIEE